MEDMQQLLVPDVKERIRLLLAITIYHTKPLEIPLMNFLTQIRLRVFSRQQANQPNLGDYTPMTETEDLRKLVGRLMRRVENLEWEREEEREREGKRISPQGYNRNQRGKRGSPIAGPSRGLERDRNIESQCITVSKR